MILIKMPLWIQHIHNPIHLSWNITANPFCFSSSLNPPTTPTNEKERMRYSPIFIWLGPMHGHLSTCHPMFERGSTGLDSSSRYQFNRTFKSIYQRGLKYKITRNLWCHLPIPTTLNNNKNYWKITHPSMGLEPTTLPSIALLREEKVPFELELIGATPNKTIGGRSSYSKC